MKVTEQEATHFFDLMWGLQFFVNQSLGIDPKIPSAAELAKLDTKRKMPIRNALWEHPELIDSYLAANPHKLSADDLALVADWKRFVKGTFYIERMLKKYAIFIENEDVYAVLGLHDAFDEFFYPQQLPVAVQTVLLPYKGRIVYDGLMAGYPIAFGGGITSELKEIYLAAKQNGRIITTLDSAGPGAGAAMEQDVEVRPDYSAQLKEISALVGKLSAGRNTPPIWSPAFRLLRVTLDLVEQAVAQPDDIEALWSKFNKVETASNRIITVLDRAER